MPATTPQAFGVSPESLPGSSGSWALWITAAIIFAECAVLLGFFLPGDTLLFGVGILVSTGVIDHHIVFVCLVLSLAAVAGNAVGYELGRGLGPTLLERPRRSLVTPDQLARTRAFFDRHGPWAIILARFVSVVRTLITVVAGIARMPRRRYLLYSAVGGVLWAAGVTALGYGLGNLPFVRNYIEPHLDLVILSLVLATLLPIGVHVLRGRRASAPASGEAVSPQRVSAGTHRHRPRSALPKA
ncbi:MAG: DedA family protein [Actinomycetota bacterium]|nr:DedA family protein [Actinomycetota bacterium]